jgi:hypothetical protein
MKRVDTDTHAILLESFRNQIPSVHLLIHSFILLLLLPRYHFPPFLPASFLLLQPNPRKKTAAMSGGAQGEINTLKNIKLSILRGRSTVFGCVYACIHAAICLFRHLFIKVTTQTLYHLGTQSASGSFCYLVCIWLSGCEGWDGMEWTVSWVPLLWWCLGKTTFVGF